jgi:hypothetical protein
MDVVLVAGDDEYVACDRDAGRSVAGALELERVVRGRRSPAGESGKKRDGCRCYASELRTANSAAASGCGASRFGAVSLQDVPPRARTRSRRILTGPRGIELLRP